MSSETVSANVERLVDHLRSNTDSQVTLGDVAGVTEVLLSIMRRYFNTIDISIYGELREMSSHISQARSEISELRPNDLKEERIPRAGKELEAIVQATEAATGTIMDAAEEIMNVDGADPEADKQAVMDACMRIFEACSFQDITGQRINKVVSTLTYIEDRLNGLQTIWGHDIADSADSVEEGDEGYEQAHLLEGPALEGEGIDQSAVDAVLAGDGTAAEEPAADTDLESTRELELEAAPETDLESVGEPESEPVPELETAPELEAEAESEPETELEAVPEPETELEVESEQGPETETELEAAPEPEPELEAAPEPEPELEAAPEPAPETQAELEVAPEVAEPEEELPAEAEAVAAPEAAPEIKAKKTAVKKKSAKKKTNGKAEKKAADPEPEEVDIDMAALDSEEVSQSDIDALFD